MTDDEEDRDRDGPPSDRVPERVRLARRERKREEDRRAERSRLGLDQ